MKWGYAEEVPDEVPLTEAQMYEMTCTRDRSRALLATRAALLRMTPMEAFAAGKVVAHKPDDSLRWDESRQLPPGPEVVVPEVVDGPPDTWERFMPGAPVIEILVESSGRTDVGRQIEEFISSGRARELLMEGYDSEGCYFDRESE